MLLRRGVHNARCCAGDAQAEERVTSFRCLRSAAGSRFRAIRRITRPNGPWAVISDSLAMEVASFGVKICTLEPGGIRTNWARRAGQNAPELLPDYEASVGSILKMLRGLAGRNGRRSAENRGRDCATGE